MIDWSKYFDRIYALHFLAPSYKTRRSLLQFQLDRVGILNSPVFEWHYTYDTPFDKKFELYIKRHTPHLREEQNDLTHVVSLAFNHYDAIRQAFAHGCKNVLILEDDIRFLRDLNKIEQILEHRPEDANIIMYDKFVFSYRMGKAIKYYNDYFSTFDNLCSAACYELDRTGMQRILNFVERELWHIDAFFYNRFCLGNLKRYCSTENMGVQGFFKKCNMKWEKKEQEKVNNLTRFYKYINIDWDNYMMRKDGSPFYYGDWIDA